MDRASTQQRLQHPLVDDLPCSILQYVDDTLIVPRVNPDHFVHLKGLLDSFTAATGLHINDDKSSLLTIAVPLADSVAMVATMGCPLANFPQTYLGLPLSIHLGELLPLVTAVENYIPGWC